MHMLQLELGRVVASGPRQGVLPAGPNQRARPDLATLTSADWDIHPVSGFNPPEPPLARLDGAFEAWERMLDEAGSLSLADPRLSANPNRSWRGRIERMVVLDAAELEDIRALRRAHVCLTFLSNLYVFSGGPRDSDGVPIVPAPIAVPLLLVSDRLDIPPVVTYAECVGVRRLCLTLQHRAVELGAQGPGARAGRRQLPHPHHVLPDAHRGTLLRGAVRHGGARGAGAADHGGDTERGVPR